MPRTKKARVEEEYESSDMDTSDHESSGTQSEMSSSVDESVPAKKTHRKHDNKKSATKRSEGHGKHGKAKATDRAVKKVSHDPNAKRKKKADSDQGNARESSKKKPAHEGFRSASGDHGHAREHHKTRQAKTKPTEEVYSEEDEESADDMTASLIDNYRRKVRKFIKSDNMFGFAKVLDESPLATVFENMHYMFVAAANNDEMLEEITRVNEDYNIVSKKFIKAVRKSEDCRHKFTESEVVAESIHNNTPLKKIANIGEYTPEFIIMKTIQAGDIVSSNLMFTKWEVAPMFAASKCLIAAFYGWEDFFSKTEKFTKSQDLVVHALCGGYKRVLQLVCAGSGAKWLLPETLQKAGLVCPVRADVKARFKKMAEGAV